MNFENSVQFSSSNLCAWSPNGRYLAVVSAKSRLVLRDAASLDVLRTEIILSETASTVSQILFSPDSQFILASDFATGLTFVFRTSSDKDSSTWKAKISEGIAGISAIQWSPDSRHILTLAEFNVKLTVWSLVQKLVRYIKYPKKKECISFSPNGNYLAVVERRDTKDCLSLFASAQDWGVARHFELFPDMDSSGCAWNGKSDMLAVYSSKLQAIVCIYALDGRCLFIYKPDEIGLSLNSVKWSNCGNVLALATSRGIEIINCLTWALISTLSVPVYLTESEQVHLLVEMEKPLETADVDVRVARELCRNPLDTQYVSVLQRPVEILPMKKSSHKRCPTVDIEFSHDNKYLVAKANSNHTCWIYEMSKLQLHSILVHEKPLNCTTWSPKTEKLTSLMIVTTNGSLHVWTPNGALCLSLPPLDEDYGKLKQVQWNPLGKALALTCEDGVVCCRIGNCRS